MQHRRAELTARAALRVGVLAAAVALAVVPPGIAADTPPEPDPHLVAAQRALAALPLADRAAQVIMTSVPGTTLSSADRRTLTALRPGGVILFAGNYRSRAQLARLTASIQAAVRGAGGARPSALVSVDQEGGVVKRLRDAPPTRSHPQLGALDDVDVTREEGRRTGVVLRRAGVHLDLAPVADLDLRPHRVMRERSFGSAPALVSRHVVAFVEGLRAGGASSSVKHFPGFGAANVNSDDALATITRTRRQLDQDLGPFRAAVAAGAETIMVSHARYTALDRRRPASTSPAAYRLLRDELGYGGIAITDSLHAAGFAAAAGVGAVPGCERVIAAGADIALLTGRVSEAVACRARLVDAVRRGRIPRTRLDEAAVRVLRLKSRLGLLDAR